MTDNNIPAGAEENTSTVAPIEDSVQEYVKGTWQETLHKSATLLDRSKMGSKRASELLWKGAKTGIEEWDSSADVSAELLYNTVLEALGGKSRKGDASKIKTVALAVKNSGLNLDGVNAKGKPFTNLSTAYAEAIRLTKTVQQDADDDSAADEAVSNIDAPKSSSTPEGAALIVLSKGIDEAARLLLDALGPKNEAAHRAFMRAISQEIVGRRPVPVKATPKAGPKAGAKQAGTPSATKAAPVVKDGAAKAKAKPVTKASPVKAAPVATKASPVKKAAPVVKRPVRPSA